MVAAPFLPEPRSPEPLAPESPAPESPAPEPHPPTLDLRGLKCPMPVLRLRKALRRMSEGQCIAVLCTDPLAAIDIPHLVREDGDRLEEQGHCDGVLRFVVRKG